MAERDRVMLQAMIGRCDWIWVEGNHDGRAPETLGGVVQLLQRAAALALRDGSEEITAKPSAMRLYDKRSSLVMLGEKTCVSVSRTF